jgi:hypothetical protein
MDTTAIKPPESMDDFGRWLNEWGDYDNLVGTPSPDYRAGYYDAMRHAYEHFTRLNPDWIEHG